MSVVVVDLTGNLDGESPVVEALAATLGASAIIRARGTELLQVPAALKDCSIVVFVGHGSNQEMRDTSLDMGLTTGNMPPDARYWLESPTLLMQLTSVIPRPFAAVFCACSALSAESAVSADQAPNCIGTVASRTIVELPRDNQLLAGIIKTLRRYLDEDPVRQPELQREVHQLVRANPNCAEFLYTPQCAVKLLPDDD